MKNSRTANSIRNVLFGIVSKIVILVLTFVGRAVFIRVLGDELLGINSLYTNILYVLSLAELGFGAAMSYSFYKPLADNDTYKLAALIHFYKKVYTIIATAVAVIGIAIMPFLDKIVKLDEPVEHLELYYLLFLANAVGSYICVYKTSIMNADQKNYIVSIYTTVATLIRVVLQIGVLLLIKDFIVYLSVMIVCTVLSNVLVSIKADKIYPFIKDEAVLDEKEKKSIFDVVRAIFVYNVSSTLLDCIDSILISAILGTVVVAYYANYTTVINNVLVFVTIVFSSITASVGNLSVTEKPEKRYEVYCIMNMVGYILSAICVTCFYTMLGDFVTLWIGEKYVLDNNVLIAFMVTIYIFCTFKATIAFREAVGLYSKIKYIVTLAALINFVLSIIFGKAVGLVGIIIATIIARGITYFWYEPIVLHKEYFNTSTKKYFVSQVINIMCVIICVIVTQTIINYACYGSGWGFLLLKGITSVVIVGIVYFLRYFKTKEFRFFINKFRRVMR